MLETIASLFSMFWNTTKVAFLTLMLPMATFFGHQPVEVAQPLPESTIATTEEALVAASTTVPVPVPPTPAPPLIPKPVPPPKPIPPVVEIRDVGDTTLVVETIPLLAGGMVRAGETVPVAYLQITNVGDEGALLRGFWVTQDGSMPEEAVIALSTVDDKGGSRGFVGGTEDAELFKKGEAFAPTDAYFASGQMRLFTIQATMTATLSSYLGTTLTIEVAEMDTTAEVYGSFPLQGTTWTAH